jgi:pimeloyl-ACP methyl ester carboxylesterase
MAVLTGCASGALKQAPTALPYHIVMVDKYGDLVGEPLPPPEECDLNGSADLDYRRPLCEPGDDIAKCDGLLDARMKAHAQHVLACAKKKNTHRIVIFIHGGLNEANGELIAAKKLSPLMWPTDGYPIFINWNSSLQSSYADRLLFVRQGRYYPRVGWLAAPAYLLNDVARAVGRSVLTAGQLLKNDYEGSVLCPGCAGCKENAHTVADRLRKENYAVSEVTMSNRADADSVWNGITWFVTLPIQWLTGPLIDAAGSAAWDVMWRRTTALSYRDADFDVVNGAKPLKARGGMARFLDALAAELNSPEQKQAGWDVVLVGHSMGAIVVNEIVRGWGERLPISDIVYMAAACTVRDYEESVWPLLVNAHKTGARVPRVHHLMLHPKAEAQDVGLAWPDFVPYPFPRGSLLVWLDGFLTNPATPLDLMAGRFTNLMRTIETPPPEVRDAIDFRVFEHGEETGQPQSHGGFGSSVRFWDPHCWGNTTPPDKWATTCMHP